MTLSWSRALYLEFFFDQTMENFLRGHVNGFASFHGSARILLYDNLKSAVVGAARQSDPFQPTAAGTGRSLPLRAEALPGAGR